jgi:hypothetical protein
MELRVWETVKDSKLMVKLFFNNILVRYVIFVVNLVRDYFRSNLMVIMVEEVLDIVAANVLLIGCSLPKVCSVPWTVC